VDAVDEIKQRLAIEDVIGEYVELKRAGRNFRGLSPFGAEKTPSFMVSPEKQIWHDFSSGKGGNIFSFVMEMEGLDFKGALEHLSRKAGVDLAQYRSSNYAKNAQIKERLYSALELASKYYQLQLKGNKDVLEYVLKERAITKDTVVEFKIGYAPAGGQALSQFLLKKGFTVDEVKKAGLGNIFNGNLRDMFRERMMIALMDSQGRVIGFTARILNDDPNAPKYINTPQTLLYDKSRHVFGLHLAKDAIRKSDFAVVVEGNMDVIASHQAGVKNVVATAGTAMTTGHLKEISRFASDIRLSFDQDKAGQNATERTVILVTSMDIKLGVITIPSGKDPDELIKADKTVWQKVVQKSEYAFDWLVEFYARDIDFTSGADKKAYANRIVPVINKINNPVEQEHYQVVVAEKLGVSPGAISKQSTPAETKRYKTPNGLQQVSRVDADTAKTENQYLSLLLMQPSLRLYMDIAKPTMLHGSASEMFEFIAQNSKDKAKDLLENAKSVQNLSDYGKVISLLYEELYANLEFIELEYEAARLQVRVIEHFVKQQKSKITANLKQETSQDEVTKLLQDAKKLDQLLKLAKETLRGERQG
jgi:DNA primase